ncbi:glycosyltransferase family 2 protein [Vibrio ponticus]|uniref:Glycosyltransferase family 2 protein n=1 Tax=Vibrio ponticus TaxID=265668 RepID=A0A3N3DT63_9VIBR|nr:glycosyltransferase family A protein [Vibrio ponticus]ROV57660.1 glycosyltransferase family 2 protein [Vibrio ponticus]
MNHAINDIKFGVVITSYNRPDFLLNAVKSLENQQLPAYEIVVVDDNSDFDVQTLLSEFSHLPITIITKDQGHGASHSRNLGIDMISSECEFIAFLDDDDAFLPNRLLAAAKDFIHNPNLDATLCSYVFMDGRKRKNTPATGFVSQEVLKKGNSYCGTSGLIIKRSVALNVRFDEEVPSGEDWELFARLSQRGNFYFNSEPLFLYRTGNHISKTNQKKYLSIAQMEHRFTAANKQRHWLGEENYLRRIATQILGDLGTKQAVWQWINFSLKKVGIAITSRVLLQIVKNKIVQT